MLSLRGAVRLTLRVKLLLVGVTATAALLAVVVGSAVSGLQQQHELADVESKLIPRLRLGPEIQTRFERLRQQMRDAVAAQDLAALDATVEQRQQLMERINQAAPTLDPARTAELRDALTDYLSSARSISDRLIAGEAGEKIVQDIEVMQVRDRRAVEVLERTTAVGEPELKSGFEAMRKAAVSAERFRLLMGGGGFLLMALLSVWLMRGVLRSLNNLSQGFGRFATGQFSVKIPVSSEDELGDAAKEANQMAESLDRLGRQRDRDDWLRATQMGLSEQLRDDVEPKELARRALWFLCLQIGAGRGALYLYETGELRLASHFAGEESEGSGASAAPTFKLGQGLIGQAALSDELMIVSNLPPGYAMIASGLGVMSPVSLVLMPLTHLNRRVGVCEFAMLRPCTDEARELLAAVREPLALALSVADSRAQQNELLAKTRELALRLVAQEEELRARNQDLVQQQGELREANGELEVQRQALSQRNGELEEARSRVQQKVEELARVSSYKSQFLANMSHELRTPLNSMLLLSGLLAENGNGNLTQKQIEHAKTVHSAGRDLLALINQVLDLAKIEAGKQEVEREVVSLRSLIDHARSVFEPLATDKGLKFVTYLAPSLPASFGTDRHRIQRILVNLLGNAIKFTASGTVTLSIEHVSPELTLTHPDLLRCKSEGTPCIAFQVRDTGPGIEQEAQARIFAPFEQAHTGRSQRHAGTGLGLAIVRESAALLGGEIQLHSEAGAGSTFTCILPGSALGRRRATADSETTQRTQLADDSALITIDDECLLLIEDDPDFAEQVIELTRAQGFKVLLATTGEEGLRAAREHLPRGIILDVGLPDVDGWTVMEHLKHDPLTRSIRVHFVSAIDTPQRGLALGAVGYLVKPTSRIELLDVIRTMTAEGGTARRRLLVVEDNPHEAESLLGLLNEEGVIVEHAVTAAEASAAVERTAFDCIILDLGLPDMDGLHLLEGLGSRTDVHRPRILVHTARTLTKSEHVRLQQYAEAVIQKDPKSNGRILEDVRGFVTQIGRRPVLNSGSAPSQDLASSLRGLRVLIADDDMRTVYALSALLRTWGAEVLVADTGQEALSVLAKEPAIDLVLMDIMMPEMDGYEAMRRIREQPRFSKLPMFALTASAMKDERERCLTAGANDYLTKPLESGRLLSMLQGWLAPSGVQA